MRSITTHVVDGDSANHQLTITVEDEPGAGGANHRYVIRGFDATSNPSYREGVLDHPEEALVLFQQGSIKEVGVNGGTQEALIAICIDRLEGFQRGPFACDDNQEALTHLNEALAWLQKRTRERIGRGVEGKTVA